MISHEAHGRSRPHRDETRRRRLGTIRAFRPIFRLYDDLHEVNGIHRSSEFTDDRVKSYIDSGTKEPLT
jgi:hypothetical protein